MHQRDSHCGWCGQPFPAAADGWPRTCAGCHNTTWRNPVPVAVLVLPVDRGVLVIRRGIEPHRGKLALPGGYINLGERWQDAAARELQEETGIRVDATHIRHLRTISAADGTLLVFGCAEPTTRAALPPFTPTAETSECVVLEAPEPLAFPLHAEVLEAYFSTTLDKR